MSGLRLHQRRWLAEFEADIWLALELVLCASLFGPQLAGWADLTGELPPGPRLGAAVVGFSASGTLTLVAARRLEAARLKARARAGHPGERELLSPLLVGMTIALVGVFAWWFLVASRSS